MIFDFFHFLLISGTHMPLFDNYGEDALSNCTDFLGFMLFSKLKFYDTCITGCTNFIFNCHTRIQLIGCWPDHAVLVHMCMSTSLYTQICQHVDSYDIFI